MEYPIEWLAGSRVSMTSALASISTAMTCRSIQLQNHSLPSCHRGDSGIPRPPSRIVGSGITSLSSHRVLASFLDDLAQPGGERLGAQYEPGMTAGELGQRPAQLGRQRLGAVAEESQ